MLKKNITIVLADDHPIMLKGIKQELELAGYSIVAAVDNGASALDSIILNQPDIALLDIEMPILNGFEVIKHCKAQELKTRYIVMTYHKQKGFVVQAKKVGVQGYLLKEDSIEEIEKCISTVMDGDSYYSSSFKENFENSVEKELKKIQLLTPSERTIIRLISQGKNSTEIGAILTVSNRTIQKHRANIIAKLELEPISDAISQWTENYKEIIISL